MTDILIDAPLGAVNSIVFLVFLDPGHLEWLVIDPRQHVVEADGSYLLEGAMLPASIERLSSGGHDADRSGFAEICRPILAGPRRVSGRVIDWGSRRGLGDSPSREGRLESALRGLLAVAPANRNDESDPELRDAWNAAFAAVA